MEIDKIFACIDANKEVYIETLKKFCAQRSISAQNVGMDEMAELVRSTLVELGADVSIIETKGYPVVYGSIDNAKPKTLAFYNHYDVQPPEPLEEWKTPPFEPTVIGEQLFARGVADNKGSMLSRIFAIDAYKKVYKDYPCNYKFIVEGEEEIGSPNLEEFKEQHPEKLEADGIIWEGSGREANRGPLEIILGVKGMCYVEMRCRCANGDFHSCNASIMPSAAWRLVWALGTIKDQNERITIDGFYDDIKPVSEEDIQYLDKLSFDEDAYKQLFDVKDYLGSSRGKELRTKMLYEPTANIAGIQAGYTGQGAKTITPGYAFCKMDFRLLPGQNPKQVFELLRAHLDARGFEDIELVYLSGEEAYRTDVQSDIVDAAIKSSRLVYGQEPSVYRNTSGTSSMAKLCSNPSIPLVCYGVGHAGECIHAPNENIYLQDFIDGIKMTAAVMYYFGMDK